MISLVGLLAGVMRALVKQIFGTMVRSQRMTVDWT